MLAKTNRNSNTEQAAPTCACGKRDYCDNSCNTFRKPVRNVYPMPAEDESFSDWQDRRTAGGR